MRSPPRRTSRSTATSSSSDESSSSLSSSSSSSSSESSDESESETDEVKPAATEVGRTEAQGEAKTVDEVEEEKPEDAVEVEPVEPMDEAMDEIGPSEERKPGFALNDQPKREIEKGLKKKPASPKDEPRRGENADSEAVSAVVSSVASPADEASRIDSAIAAVLAQRSEGSADDEKMEDARSPRALRLVAPGQLWPVGGLDLSQSLLDLHSESSEDYCFFKDRFDSSRLIGNERTRVVGIII